jgi:hypothetical protein
MVALAAGLLVASAAYALAKSSVDAFQQEARMQATQYGSTLGLNRLANDLRRAGYMATPNIADDPHRCGPAPTDFAANMLRAINIVQGTDPNYGTDLVGGSTHPVDPRLIQSTNGRRPDRVTLAGNFASGELFQVASVEDSTIHLQDSSSAISRTRAQAIEGGPSVCGLFRPGGRNQFARIVDSVGLERYVIITDCAETADDTGAYPTYRDVRLTYANTAGWSAPPCVPPVITNATVNPVNVVDYSIVNVRDAAVRASWGLDDSYGAMVGSLDANEAAITGDANRTELVRRVWDAGGNVVPGSGEIVSEFAVDLNFGVWHVTTPGGTAMALAPFKTIPVSVRPQDIRGVRVRLSTRARAADRVDGPDTNVANPALPLRRFDVFADTSNVRQRFARVRNAFVDVTLHNLRNVRW